MKIKHAGILLLIMAILVTGCATNTPAAQPTALPPTEVPPTEQPPAAEPTVSADLTWDRVQAAGKIVFGTSVDYPPFEYYDQTYQPIGYDIALAREIGSKLGLQVQFTDIPFDGLFAAIQVGQIDAAIAAISFTPDRQQYVDFTNVYYNGQTAVLARQGSGFVKISDPAQMAQYRVGVERGTTHEQWVKSTLIQPGLMPLTNLFAYQKPEHAVRDLLENRVDLVVMGSLPAEEFVNAGGVELVGDSLNPQLFAIALPKRSPTLQSKLNDALVQLQNDGTLARLSSEYLNIQVNSPSPLPTVPPSNSSTAVPASCDSMTYVADLTIPDGTRMDPKQDFDKTWRIQNTGTCTWDNSYKFVFVQGDQMGGSGQKISGSVAPGQTYDITIDQTAPSNPGSYTGFWQMVNGQGAAFGARIWVKIEVKGKGQPQGVAPQIDFFTSDATSVKGGNPVNISWSFSLQDVVSATLTRTNPDGSQTQLYGGADVPNSDTYTDLAGAPGTYVYTLSVSTEFGGTVSKTVEVTVKK